jgi:alginate O-acetyltransferase complex protein AlgI
MLFNSYEFLFLFLPFGLLVFHGAGKFGYSKAQLPIMLILSIAFYMRTLGPFWYVLFFSIAWNYATGNRVVHFATHKRDSVAKWTMRIGIAGNLALLGYFKYSLFTLSLLGISDAHVASIIPLGISFYTFTQIAFLIDLYRGEAAQCGALKYSLFVTYFPHLIAGPIIHHKDVIPQFDRIETGRGRSYVAVGVVLLSIGLFKKTVIADTLSPLVSPIFDQHPIGSAFSDCWLATLAYTLQLYFDFSAYSDMALGISLLFGIKLPINFFSPYKATSIIDFWRRWHISLSNFLRDYVYFSLGGNRRGRPRKYLNIFLTMLIGGVWHGSGFTFIIWGALHGLMILLNHVWRDCFVDRVTPRSSFLRGLGRSASWTTTFFVVTSAWVFFRAPNLSAAKGVLSGMLTWQNPAAPIGSLRDWIVVAIGCVIAWTLPNAYQIVHWRASLNSKDGDAFIKSGWNQSPISAATFGVVLGIAIVFIQRHSEFLYWQF